MALEVKIKKEMGDFHLEVALTAEQEIMAILGASGCGKSMTLKCIAGIEQPDEGYIRLNGRTLYDSQKKINLPPQKRHVGYMFQEYALFPHMTALENLEIVLKAGGKKDVRLKAEKLIDHFQLEGLQALYPDQLSGGQKQRLAMARMLAADPELILLDEPFSALDSHLRWKLEQDMKELLKGMQRTTLFVSHSRDEVYRLCDTVGSMQEGKLERKMTVKELFEHPGSWQAAILSGCKNITKLKVLSDKEAYAPAWNLKIPLPKEPGRDLAYVGIRAHFLSRQTKEAAISLKVCQKTVIEEPFEWVLLFRNEGAAEEMQWRVSKKEVESLEKLSQIQTLYIEEKDLLFLRE